MIGWLVCWIPANLSHDVCMFVSVYGICNLVVASWFRPTNCIGGWKKLLFWRPGKLVAVAANAVALVNLLLSLSLEVVVVVVVVVVVAVLVVLWSCNHQLPVSFRLLLLSTLLLRNNRLECVWISSEWICVKNLVKKANQPIGVEYYNCYMAMQQIIILY